MLLGRAGACAISVLVAAAFRASDNCATENANNAIYCCRFYCYLRRNGGGDGGGRANDVINCDGQFAAGDRPAKGEQKSEW
jgi:hypothetical protein